MPLSASNLAVGFVDEMTVFDALDTGGNGLADCTRRVCVHG